MSLGRARRRDAAEPGRQERRHDAVQESASVVPVGCVDAALRQIVTGLGAADVRLRRGDVVSHALSYARNCALRSKAKVRHTAEVG